ncbi:MAG: hypothetical protein ACO1SV_15070 [Fimbriimonas sp.]
MSVWGGPPQRSPELTVEPAMLRWLLAAFLAAPATILLHEGAHWIAARTLGFRDPRLHAFSIDFVAGEYPNSHRLIVAAAGFLMTALLTLTAGALALRRPTPIRIAVLLAAPLRALMWLPIAIVVALGKATVGEGDEVDLSRLTDLPLEVTAGSAVGLLLFAVVAAILAFRKLERRQAAVWGTLIGLVLGWTAYGLAGDALAARASASGSSLSTPPSPESRP